MNHKHEALWPLKRCTLYILCTLILSNSLHLTIGLSLILIKNELWVPKCCHAHSKILFSMFRVSRKCHQDFNLLHIYYTCYTSFLGVKNGSPIMCFHSTIMIKYIIHNLWIFKINIYIIINTIKQLTQ